MCGTSAGVNGADTTASYDGGTVVAGVGLVVVTGGRVVVTGGRVVVVGGRVVVVGGRVVVVTDDTAGDAADDTAGDAADDAAGDAAGDGAERGEEVEPHATAASPAAVAATARR